MKDTDIRTYITDIITPHVKFYDVRCTIYDEHTSMTIEAYSDTITIESLNERIGYAWAFTYKWICEDYKTYNYMFNIENNDLKNYMRSWFLKELVSID